MAEESKKVSERVIVEKTVKGPKLVKVLKAEYYTLLLTSKKYRLFR